MLATAAGRELPASARSVMAFSIVSCEPGTFAAALPADAASVPPRDNKCATPISTPSKIVCTRLKAAVMPILPPS